MSSSLWEKKKFYYLDVGTFTEVFAYELRIKTHSTRP